MTARRVCAVLAATLVFASVACKPRVIDLAADAPPDTPTPCACRLRCMVSAVECTMAGSGSLCGADQFCTGSLGTCTAGTQNPCDGSAALSVCTRDATSTVACGQ